MDDEITVKIAPPPKKRSLFSKSAIAKASTEEEPVAFFSRANELFPQRLTEEQKKREKKLQRVERKRSSTGAEAKEPTPPTEKRRKVSHLNSREGYSSEGSGLDGELPRTRRESTNTTPGSRKSRRGSNNHDDGASPISLSARYGRDLKNQRREELKKPIPAKGYIFLSDSDSDDHVDNISLPVQKPATKSITLDDEDDYGIASRRLPALHQTDDDNQLSDEEFPELVQQARERERIKAQQLNASKEQNHTVSDEDVFQFESTVDADPTIEILITSKMEGTRALMVRRKMSQRLREVRYSWCDKQEMQADEIGRPLKDVIFLTWKNTRLYDSTTCRALPGLTKNGSEGLSLEGDGFAANGKLHFEAWTPDAFEVQKKRNIAKQKREQEGSDDEETKRQKREEDAVPKCKIIMKARDLDPFKLFVKPHTTIEKMISAFRTSRDVPDDKAISLYFDGDKLDPESTIADTELGDVDDIDTVEVHIK